MQFFLAAYRSESNAPRNLGDWQKLTAGILAGKKKINIS